MPLLSWTYECTEDELFSVFPDGCQDIIFRRHPDGSESRLLTALDGSASRVRLERGVVLHGVRLRPGTRVDGSMLAEIRTVRDCQALADRPANTTLCDVVDDLARPGRTLRQTARSAGLSERSLRRHLRDAELPSPYFWKSLAQARRAARSLSSASLASVALEQGYCDQAHMTRSFRRFFGVTPVQLRASQALQAQVDAPGLGNWLGG